MRSLLQDRTPPLDVVDLRSDTVTRPSAAMRRAIAEAEVGDAVLGDDPTVAELERLAAEMLGKERALFFPSGIMANQTALLVLAEPGTEAVIDAGGHILNWEEGGAAAWGGIQLRAVQTPDGFLTPALLSEAIRPDSPFLPRTTLLCLENTHNGAGGRVLSVAQTEALCAVARERGVRVHLDGARLANAAVALDLSMAELASPADTVMLALSKGLGAPVGSVLAGSGIFGLRHHFERLAEDHARARTLASRLDALPGLSAAAPDTNIVMVDLVAPGLAPAAVLSHLEEAGVRVVPFGPRRLRAVIHLDIDDAGVERAATAFASVIETLLDREQSQPETVFQAS